MTALGRQLIIPKQETLFGAHDNKPLRIAPSGHLRGRFRPVPCDSCGRPAKIRRSKLTEAPKSPGSVPTSFRAVR